MDDLHRARFRLNRPWTRPALILFGAMLTTSAHAASRFVTFINDDAQTVTTIQTAPVGTHRWHSLELGGPLIGGESGQATVRFDDAEPCKQDLAINYREMGRLTVTGFDTCRTKSLYLGQVRSKAIRSAAKQGPTEGRH